MLTTTIRRTFTHDGKSAPVPPDVLARVEEVDQVLKDELKELDDIPITGEWASQMSQHGTWEVVLLLRSGATLFTYTFPAADLTHPGELRQNLRWVVNGFARQMTGEIRKHLRQLQGEMKQFIAEGKE